MISNITTILKSMSDPNRLRIIKMLEVKPLCVCEITDILKLATSTVSKHLTILKEAGLIIDNKIGRWVTYETNTSMYSIASEIYKAVTRNLDNDPTIMKDTAIANKIKKELICAKNKKGLN